MKVALIHDYLKEYGGAERVVETLHEIFPQAPLYVSIFDPKGLGIHADRFKNWDIRTSWMQKIPFITKLLSPLKFLSPIAFESFNLGDFDLVISSSSAYYSKAVITPARALHINYVHTPPRYLYGYTNSTSDHKNILKQILIAVLNHLMRIWDFELSQRPDILVANSQNVRKRIQKFYRRDAVVIYPPVDVRGIKSQVVGSKQRQKDYLLYLGRLDRGKRVDLIILACNQLGLPLKVAGSGAEENNLKKIAGSTVEFVGSVSDAQRAKLYAGAKGLILAAEDEDFGITSVEAQVSGTPVIALKAGGYLETVISGKTGVFFNEPTVESLVAVLPDFDPSKFKTRDLQKNAVRFSKEKFKRAILDLIDKNLRKM